MRDSNLFFLDAITAPEKPIQRVKCWTKTEEATTPVLPKIRETTSIKGRETSKAKIAKVKYFSNWFKYDKKILNLNYD